MAWFDLDVAPIQVSTRTRQFIFHVQACLIGCRRTAWSREGCASATASSQVCSHMVIIWQPTTRGNTHG